MDGVKIKKMGKTKYIKVSTADRLPEKEGDYFCIIANGPSIMTCRSMYFERFKGITHWLEEKPDYEDEMKEMLEDAIQYLTQCDWRSNMIETYGNFVMNAQEVLSKIK